MDRLEEALGRLAEAQARTEERVAQMEEGQRELQAAVARLAEAQARTEVALQALAQQVGRLTETDLAREVTPAYLAHQLPARSLPVLFGFVIHPSAREMPGRLGAVVISSSGR
jgi:hypothetical protein